MGHIYKRCSTLISLYVPDQDQNWWSSAPASKNTDFLINDLVLLVFLFDWLNYAIKTLITNWISLLQTGHEAPDFFSLLAQWKHVVRWLVFPWIMFPSRGLFSHKLHGFKTFWKSSIPWLFSNPYQSEKDIVIPLWFHMLSTLDSVRRGKAIPNLEASYRSQPLREAKVLLVINP